MKLVMTLLVRNEADIIEANLDYHLAQGVDFVIVTDHGSTDGTRDLLRRYEQAGVVSVLREEGEQHHQSRRVTRMARLALSQHGADWVIHNDADEFWWPLAGNLRDVFSAIPAGYGQIEVSRRNFLPRPDGPGPFYSRLIYRDRESQNLIGRPVEPKVAHRARPDVTVAPGNHSLSGGQLRPVPLNEMLEVLHFPMRSYEQFERKVIQIGTGYETLEHRSPEVGRDQLTLLQIFRDNGLRQFYEAALLDDEALQRGIDDGQIVLDRRLQDFIRGLPRCRPANDRPDGPQARAFIARALETSLEVEAAQGAHTEAQAQVKALSRRLDAVEAELTGTTEMLQLLRESRVMRWTAPLRRLWYRARSRAGAVR
ncbi:MAG TPA: glycosyltransferase family 2 protein [Solirubrobacteraceae bacterium]|nr:glycosyltransferase family 2 protein [Solirubrobacteraceae bacterium]